MPEALTTRDFLPYLHTQFQIEQFESYKLELTEVTENPNAQLEQFSLIFTGTASPEPGRAERNPAMRQHICALRQM